MIANGDSAKGTSFVGWLLVVRPMGFDFAGGMDFARSCLFVIVIGLRV